MKKRRSILLIIAVMLIMIAISLAWLFSHGIESADAERGEAIRETVESFLRDEAGDVLAVDTDTILSLVASSHIYSHRGSAGSNEHSFTAYDEAISAGSRYIEQDVVLSADGVLFVSHDLSASKMTGTKANYSGMNAADIDNLTTYSGNKILRLSEVFDRYGRSVDYVIELKTSDRNTIRAFEQIIEEYGYEDIVIVQSSSTDVLSIIEDSFPELRKLHLCRSQGEFNRDLELPYVDIISVKASNGLMGENNCAAAHDHSKLFSAWTLDSESDIVRAIDIGVDTYFTNNTELAMSLEKEYRLQDRSGDRN